MKKYILGLDSISGEIEQYENAPNADFNAEDWCYVDAESLNEAIAAYDETFERLKSEGKINGCM